MHQSYKYFTTKLIDTPYCDISVRNQNEELMNSLDREEFGPSENNTEYINTYK